ncbi:hypothetical protein STVIR_5938 [Streptomyces viridochromogenes Tue57]|uniref:Uncharacterized protein n=1 Tax=Streptomyces viridochromogenes Tue57 TaxID=1160705 RepID=L8P696_STRVR|nr:hypothetical protein STVIR_5938 [Streptomyces viridochromogenes Tue57]
MRRYDVLRPDGQRDHRWDTGGGQGISREWRICHRSDQ